MKWPPRRLIRSGKRAVSQRQSHEANVRRELREDDNNRKRRDQENKCQ